MLYECSNNNDNDHNDDNVVWRDARIDTSHAANTIRSSILDYQICCPNP